MQRCSPESLEENRKGGALEKDVQGQGGISGGQCHRGKSGNSWAESYHQTAGGCVTASNVLASRALVLLLAMKWEDGNGYFSIRLFCADVCKVLPIIPDTR